jgi:chromosome segregation ATPase
MQELIAKISSDPVLMLSSAVAVVVLIFVVLVVVVASMRIKVYKDRFINIRMDDREKEERIAQLEKELDVLQHCNSRNEEALNAFDETKEHLNRTQTQLSQTEERLSQTEQLLSKTKKALEEMTDAYEVLKQEHHALQERFESTSEENNKLRVNNARLLMKLESEERSAAVRAKAQKEKGQS